MKPILFNSKMVRAILDGQKTQTRRKIDLDIINNCDIDVDGTLLNYQNDCGDFINPVELCKYQPGDVLYVRETWADNIPGCPGGVAYRADHEDPRGDGPANPIKWKPSIHMPKAAARIFLRVTGVRVERLNDITEEDALEEGCVPAILDGAILVSARGSFHALWESLYGKCYYNWERNPWVWVITFEQAPF